MDLNIDNLKVGTEFLGARECRSRKTHKRLVWLTMVSQRNEYVEHIFCSAISMINMSVVNDKIVKLT